MIDRIEDQVKEEMEVLEQLKKDDMGSDDAVLEKWDFAYYNNKQKKQLQVDEE